MDELNEVGGVVAVRIAGRRAWELGSATLEYTRGRRPDAALHDGDTRWQLSRGRGFRRRMIVADAAGGAVATYAETSWLRSRGSLELADRHLDVETWRGTVQVREALRALLTVAPSPWAGS